MNISKVNYSQLLHAIISAYKRVTLLNVNKALLFQTKDSFKMFVWCLQIITMTPVTMKGDQCQRLA